MTDKVTEWLIHVVEHLASLRPKTFLGVGGDQNRDKRRVFLKVMHI